MERVLWKYVCCVLFCSLLLFLGFFIAVQFHFSAIDHSIKSAKYRKMIEGVEAEERRLSLSRNIILSSIEIKKTDIKPDLNYEPLKLSPELNGNLKKINADLKSTDANYKNILLEIKNSDSMTQNFDTYGRFSLSITFMSIVTFIFLFVVSRKSDRTIIKRNNFSVISEIIETLFSKKNQIEVFSPLISDWQEEYFEALFKKEFWKSRWINVRYAYALLAAIWMKSPIGDLIEFVIKIAKP